MQNGHFLISVCSRKHISDRSGVVRPVKHHWPQDIRREFRHINDTEAGNKPIPPKMVHTHGQDHRDIVRSDSWCGLYGFICGVCVSLWVGSLGLSLMSSATKSRLSWSISASIPPTSSTHHVYNYIFIYKPYLFTPKNTLHLLYKTLHVRSAMVRGRLCLVCLGVLGV